MTKHPFAVDPSAPRFGRRSAHAVAAPQDVAKIIARLQAATVPIIGSQPNALSRPSNQLIIPPRRRQLDRETGASADAARVIEAAAQLEATIFKKLDTEVISRLARGELALQLHGIVAETLSDHDLQMNQVEQRDLVTMLLNAMIGLGPLETLMSDDSITDVLVNGPENVYVERAGRLERTEVKFRDNAHVMDLAIRIANRMGRRIDETLPYVDARLPDGSRVNIITPPLALKGPTISIRKFSRRPITLDLMVQQGNLSAPMAALLSIAARSRLNILISGGTGAGKTTLLNALSQLIDPGERIITIEDAAELQLQQPHVVPLETRMVNIEGRGEVTIRDLVRNALRMRPDRIVLGEIRGGEALDMMQAMNTGHDGSLCTIHANKPRDALTRLEHMVCMAGVNLPTKVIRAQIASAVNLIVQVARMRDGVRRVTNVSELVGLEGDVVVMQDLFGFEYDDLADGKIQGRFVPSGNRPKFGSRAHHYGLEQALIATMNEAGR